MRHTISPLLFLALTVPCLAAEPGKHPNVVVILADDQGWGDLSINGNTNLETAHIDSLGKDGARFERFFVQPVCAPTRAEFLTGRWHPRCDFASRACSRMVSQASPLSSWTPSQPFGPTYGGTK